MTILLSISIICILVMLALVIKRQNELIEHDETHKNEICKLIEQMEDENDSRLSARIADFFDNASEIELIDKIIEQEEK